MTFYLNSFAKPLDTNEILIYGEASKTSLKIMEIVSDGKTKGCFLGGGGEIWEKIGF